jgi:hygromycin-B 7''-O-kinase
MDGASLAHPVFDSITAYAQQFTNVDYWKPYVELVCARHQLTPGSNIRAGLPGTHPVFIVDERYVVKLYTDLFNSASSIDAEIDVYRLLGYAPQIPAPALFAHGTLFSKGEGWSWPYIVIEALPGISLDEAGEQVTYRHKLALARYLGPVVRSLHTLPLSDASYRHGSWDAFIHFLAKQRAACVDQHTRWQTIPDHLIAQIDAYLPPLETLADQTGMPSLLHADLNADHVLGFFQDDHWHTTGIIDFGDAKVGDPLFELIALHIGLFDCDKHLLQAFLECYGFHERLRDRFVLRAMSYTLLFEFNVFHSIFQILPTAHEVATLDELAALLWDLDT